MARPKDLVFNTCTAPVIVPYRSDDSPWDVQDIIDSARATTILSPVVSEVSTSSVNERQRKLSETIVDWVFDDSETKCSDFSGDTSSTIDDGNNNYCEFNIFAFIFITPFNFV